MTLAQRNTPPELVGRVSAALDALASGPQAVAIGAGALVVGLVDYRLLFAAVGALLLAAGAYLLTGRRLTIPRTGGRYEPDDADGSPGPATLPVRLG